VNLVVFLVVFVLVELLDWNLGDVLLVCDSSDLRVFFIAFGLIVCIAS